MNRRDMLRRAGATAALAASSIPFARADNSKEAKKKPKLLMFSRSEGFQHPVVQRKGNKLSLAEKIVTGLGKRHGFEVVCSKDGRIFVPETLREFDAFLFQSQGDLLKEKSVDGQPPMTADGKKAFLDLIAEGKGFVGCHCASDTFHSPAHRNGDYQHQDKLDPYIEMIGGEFISHGAQQKAWMRVTDKEFPGADGLDDLLEDFQIVEEWYSLKNFAPDLHVILVQDNEGMKGRDYERPNFPATWARQHGKGRVFFTSMGHREDVWLNAMFQQLLLGGLSWAFRHVDADLTPNMKTTAPKGRELSNPKK
jgi:uncharacterized protein